jgi:hypothetical protein
MDCRFVSQTFKVTEEGLFLLLGSDAVNPSNEIQRTRIESPGLNVSATENAVICLFHGHVT